MTEDVVDLFESIKIKKQNCAVLLLATSVYELLLQAIFQKLAIRQTGKLVKMRLTIKRFLTLCAGQGNCKAPCNIDGALQTTATHFKARIGP